MKKIEQEKNRPAANLPYQTISKPFRCQYIIPLDDSIEIQQDANGVCYLRAKGGSLDSLVAGDNIRIDRREDGSTVISSVNTDREIYGGQNVVVFIDPDTGAAVISAFYDGTIDDEHYKGIFKDTEELMAAVLEPVQGDYALVRDITITDGEATWNGRYKLAFYDSGLWQIVDQMMTFTNNPELLRRCWSVGGSSPVIYLSNVAGSGDFWDLLNIPIVATPVATVNGNTITVTCETEGAEIWYSTDGSMPHVNGTKYTGPVTASQSATYRFVGIKNGMINSLEAVVGAGYSLEAPTITLDWTTGEVSMANPNASGEIRYTLDGSEPDETSLLYSDPIFPAPPVGTLLTVIKAIVYDSGSNLTSSVTESVIKKAGLEGNIIILAINGSWSERWYVANEQHSMVEGSEVHYTTDHTTPDYQSDEATGWLSFNRYGSENPVQLKLIGFRPGYFPSDIKNRNIGYEKPTAPDIAFDALTDTVTLSRAGNVLASPEIPLKTDNSNPADGCRIYYTLDGSTPTDQSTLYTDPFQISGNVTVKAVLIAYGQYSSDVSSEEISIVAAPIITLDSKVGDISITGPAGATIYYTRDGSTPTPGSTRYTMPINVMNSAHEEIRAIAVLNGSSSTVAVAEFQGLSWRDNGSVNVNYTSGVVTITPKIAADGATLSYGIGSNGGYPASYCVYRNPVTLQLFDTDGKRVFFKQQKYGYIPNIYEADFTTQVSVDVPEIIYDENTGKATIALDGNTSDIPLYTTTNLPSLGARIYYTTDGTTPSADNGTLYDGVSEIQVSVGETLKAMTECYGEYDSEVNDWARTPKISVDSTTGLMTIINPYGSQTRYTLDGSTPTRYSSLYSEPVDVSVSVGSGKQSLTIKAAAFENNVAIAVSELTMPVVAIEQIGLSFVGPGMDDGISVSAYIAGVDDVSVFTSRWSRIGGGLPDASGLIETWEQAGIKAYRCEVFDIISAFGHSTPVQYSVRFYQGGYIPLDSFPLPVGFDTPDAPSVNYNDTAMTATFARAGNTAWIPLKTDNINPEQGCRIYYTLDGSTPTDQDTLWDGNAVQCQAGDLIKAICVCYGQYVSGVTVQNVYVPESALSDDDVAVIVKNTTSGNLKYVPYDKCVVDAIDSDDYTLKEFIRFTRGKNDRPVFMHKDQTSGMWAEFNRYRLACDTTAPGGFDWSVVINGTTKSGNVTWQAGDTLDDILDQLNTQAVATYLVFTHVSGENFIRIRKGGYNNSTFALSNNTGATLTDLSLYTKIGDVQQAETHRDWQSMNVDAMFPTLGFLAANTVQYAVNGYNLSYMCGGNETKYKEYYRTNGSSTYLAENAVFSRMSEEAFNALDGSGVAEQQELYDKYDGSWDAYMEASMVKIDDANSNGIEYQSYDDGDTQTVALASITTMDFDGSYIPAFPCAAHCQNFTDNDVANGKFNMNTEHELAVFMRDAKMADINAAFDVLISAGMTATKLSVSSYYYWSVARYNSNGAWLFYADRGRLHYGTLYDGFTARPLAYPVNS